MRRWPDEPTVRAQIELPRDDLVAEDVGDQPGVYVQREGPFARYERTVTVDGGHVVERTRYRLSLPWFGWLFAPLVRAAVARRGRNPATDGDTGGQPFWAPPDRLTHRQISVLGLLAAASMSSAFVNTLFTQTVTFAADDFGVGKWGQGIAGTIVRAGIVLALPIAVLADRIGRRRMIVFAAWFSPLCSALGAVAPNFSILVATQAVGRPVGLALDLLVAVVAAEEMPRNSRAYAVSVLAMASGLGAGIAVSALPLADRAVWGWRLVYVVALVWLLVAVDLARRLPETRRFEAPHRIAPPLDMRRFGILAAVAFFGNFFVAPASFFQNNYLDEVRGYSASRIALFTLCTATPAGIGLIVGGRLADIRGRRALVVIVLPIATASAVISYGVAGAPMWLAAFGYATLGGVMFPALAVYRAELFPTGNRGRAAGFLTASALIGGSVGLPLGGYMLDHGWSHVRVFSLFAIASAIVAAIVFTTYPETAHRALEDLNPEDLAPT